MFGRKKKRKTEIVESSLVPGLGEVIRYRGDPPKDEMIAIATQARLEARQLLESCAIIASQVKALAAQQARLDSAITNAGEAIKIAAELRHEWQEAKHLSKVFEQRQFLGQPETRGFRAILHEKNNMPKLSGATIPVDRSLRELLAGEHKADPEGAEDIKADLATEVRGSAVHRRGG